MSENNHLIMRTILGAVLGFQGAKLVGQVLQDRPENYIMFVAIGIAFIAIGVVFAVTSIKKYIQFTKNSGVDVVSYEDLKKADANKEEVAQKEGEDESCE